MPQQSARALVPLVLATSLTLPSGSSWAGPTAPPPVAESRDRAVATAPPAAVDPALDGARSRSVDVVVQARPGADAGAAVRRAGGRAGAALPLVDGVAAEVPVAGLRVLADDPAVLAVTKDRSGRLLGADLGRSAATPTEDVPAHAVATGAAAAWARGVDGRGLGIAVIDTGVSSVPDLAGRLVQGPDLSGEGTAIDTHGHGTVMAGLAAGDGSGSGGARRGIAPGATVVAVKVAGRDGDVAVSTVLQAMQWVSAHADQHGIRVLNLSWGVPSSQDPAVDPIDEAVERLWQQGIVVVVGAGNAGPAEGTVTQPADSPSVLTVGALDDHRTLDPRDDTVPDWSSRGPTAHGVAKPDLVAPGRSLVSTRSPGSAVEAENPTALVAPGYITGSGTSQAAAVTSGLAALLLADRPHLTPDQVKDLLVGTASEVPGAARYAAGAGRVSLDRALAAEPDTDVQQRLVITGPAGLAASRGARREPTLTSSTWNGSTWNGSTWNGSTWNGSTWNGSTWNASTWNGSTWNAESWGEQEPLGRRDGVRAPRG